MSVESLRDDPALADIYNTTLQLHDGFAGTAFYLLHEALNASSRWRPFLCSLPRTFPLPLFAPPPALRAHLAALPPAQRPAFLADLERQRDAVALLGATVLSTLAAAHPARFPPAAYTRPRWAWACAAVMSRSWTRPVDDAVMRRRAAAAAAAGVPGAAAAAAAAPQAHVLAPAADLPNHHAAAREAERGPAGALVLRAAGNLTAGDQARPPPPAVACRDLP